MSDDNIWTDEWDAGEDWSGGGAKSKRLPRAEVLGATVYELGPGNFAVYHFHHAAEEMLVVLDGEMTMKTEDGERLVRRGEVVMFPVGPAGAHGFRNDGDGTCRYLMTSTHRPPRWRSIPSSARSRRRPRPLRRPASGSGSSTTSRRTARRASS